MRQRLVRTPKEKQVCGLHNLSNNNNNNDNNNNNNNNNNNDDDDDDDDDDNDDDDDGNNFSDFLIKNAIGLENSLFF